MRVALDTNVVLDVLLDQQPYAGPAGQLFVLADTGRIQGIIGATTVMTIFYIAAKSFGARRARALIHDLLALFDVATVDHDVLARALLSDMNDFEDAVLHEAVLGAGAQVIASRDRHGFTKAAIPALSPEEMLAVIANLRSDS